MRSFFLKIFLWFWLAMILLGVSQSVVTPITHPGSASAAQHELIAGALTSYAREAAARADAGGATLVDDYCRGTGERSRMRLWLFDARERLINRDRAIRDVPDPARRVVARALGGRDVAVTTSDHLAIVARSARTAAGHRYVLVGIMDQDLWEQPYFPPATRAWRLLAVILTAGAVCYWLARNLTAPVVRLRAATRQLASGDLQARVGPAMGKRRDELAELGRDFDRMAERIEFLMLSQRRLLGDISHELRSPLARLNVALALAFRHGGAGANGNAANGNAANANAANGTGVPHGANPNPALLSDLRRIEREAERLNELIGQLLALARMDSGDGVAQPQPVELDRLVQEVAADADFEARSQQRGVQVVASEECWTCGNPELLRSAVENVLRNAIRYTRQDTTVEVTLHRKHDDSANADYAIINVRDRGEGVPEQSLTDLFRPFYRVGEARERQSGGAGLGLAITERAVRSHGGRVLAANVPGGGLRIELRLPAVPRPTP